MSGGCRVMDLGWCVCHVMDLECLGGCRVMDLGWCVSCDGFGVSRMMSCDGFVVVCVM